MKLLSSCLPLLCFLLVLGPGGASAYEIMTVNNSMFADVPLEHTNYNAIYYLKNTGVVQGDSGQNLTIPNYRPNDSVNRAEFLKMTIEGNDIPLSDTYKSCFPDVPGDQWYTKYICKAKEEGWIAGYPDGYFRPEQTINQVESIKIVGEVTGWEKHNLGPGEEWFEAYMKPAEDKNIIPTDDNAALMTRADIAELVFRNGQINTLNIPAYDPLYNPALFATVDIPITGPLGPGGLLGPGGPMGPSGAFVTGGAFDPEKGMATLIPDSYYSENHCYFSDEGAFSGDNLGFLKDYTQEDLDKFVEGASLDEFGKMFCYTGIAATDLKYFDEELREEFDVLCWQLPDSPAIEEDGFSELFCWARQKDDYQFTPQVVDQDARISIEVIDRSDFAILYDTANVEILRFKLKTLEDEAVPVTAIDLESYGEADPYPMRRMKIMDENGNVYYDGPTYLIHWKKGVLTLPFEPPILLFPGEELTVSVYADFDWEEYTGDIQIGFWNGTFSNEAISVIGERIAGAIIGIEEELKVDEDPEMPLCNIGPMEAENPAADGGDANGDAGDDEVHLDNSMHLVSPIQQQGSTCIAAAVYSSLRWLEQTMGVDKLVENGQEGYDTWIERLHGDGWITGNYTSHGQFRAIKYYINDEQSACLKADFNTNWGYNVTCQELLDHYNEGCDIPFAIACTPPGSTDPWRHGIDLVDIKIDPDNPGSCEIIFANSWAPWTGELGGAPLDGLGGGVYQKATYNEETGSFTTNAPSFQGASCEFYGAAYVCVDSREICRGMEGLDDPLSIPGTDDAPDFGN